MRLYFTFRLNTVKSKRLNFLTVILHLCCSVLLRQRYTETFYHYHSISVSFVKLIVTHQVCMVYLRGQIMQPSSFQSLFVKMYVPKLIYFVVSLDM